MDIIFNILTHDRLINKLLKKYPELNLYIRVYKASTFSALKTKSPSFMSALSNLLAPGLLAYCCYVNKIDIFFPPKEENKGWGGRFRPHHINTNINKKMDALFRIVNESIKKYQERQNGWPYINFPVYARTLALDDIQDAILENIDIFKKRHTLQNHSFWNLCLIFYGGLPDNIFHIPSFELKNYYIKQASRNRLNKLKASLFAIAKTSSIKWKNGFKGGIRLSHSDENNESFPHIIPFTISSDKERNCYEPAKDLITASMKLESWEMLTYFDPSSNQFEYLPFKEAHAVSFIEYLNVNLPQNDSNDNGVLEYSYRAMISTIIFLIGIYGFDGHPTNNAGRILKWMRFEKKKKHTKQLFSRGCNTQFWYPKPPTPSIPYKYVFDRLVR